MWVWWCSGLLCASTHCQGCCLWWWYALPPTLLKRAGWRVCYFCLQAYLDKAKSSVHVDAMLFAPPNVGDKAFAEAYGAAVNGRR